MQLAQDRGPCVASNHAASRRISPTVMELGTQPYEPVWAAMRDFSRNRSPASDDSFWCLQHPPVYTTGLRERTPPPEIGGIQLVPTDRGGLRTCHAPGQLVVYPLLNLRRLGLGVGSYVRLLEQAVISVLAEWGMAGARRVGMPGVYVDNAKVAFIGVRVVAGNCYHGLSLNIGNDLSLFDTIVPCGISGLRLTRMADHDASASVGTVAPMLLNELWQNLYGMEYEPHRR